MLFSLYYIFDWKTRVVDLSLQPVQQPSLPRTLHLCNFDRYRCHSWSSHKHIGCLSPDWTRSYFLEKKQRWYMHLQRHIIDVKIRRWSPPPTVLYLQNRHTKVLTFWGGGGNFPFNLPSMIVHRNESRQDVTVKFWYDSNL